MTFHDLHHGDRPLVLPNAWDFITGAVLAEAGHPAIGTTSLGVAAAAGKPDATGDTRAETVALARSLARLPVWVTVDIEGGFSTDPGAVGDLVAELDAYGIAGVNIEDGRGDGSLMPMDHQAELVAAAKAAAPGVFVNARTDTFWLPMLAGAGEPSMAETLRRAAAYTDAGADGIFVPGAATDADVAALTEALSLPLNVLHLPGRTAYGRLAELGVRRISTGSLLIRAALKAVLDTAATVPGEPADTSPMPSYQEIQRLLDQA
ncbi:MAG: isocitrate lyase/phosphoenolpyruvate mutase family protein [Streptosporangiales bacterium]|nr:isocitrate lyase/phosphoenolpyruvate mutase family protein [Streptosporangiales bacterium]